MVINNSVTAYKGRREKKHAFRLRWILLGVLLLCVGAAVAALLYEAHTSKFQARRFSQYAASLSYRLGPGPSAAINYPGAGPFDLRLGYTRLPQLLERVRMRGMQIEAQTRFSAALMAYSSRGYFTPFPEKAQAGLRIADCGGEGIYESLHPRAVYTSFEAIPPLMVQTLLFIENRKLLDTARVYMNPAVDWARFSRAMLLEAGRSVGLRYKTIGGSTLATQMEKYRHSPAGITTDPQEKLRQMISASVRTYQNGPETLAARKQSILSYINSVPLSAAPGYGEVHGLIDGLKVWFGEDVAEVNRLLRLPDAKGDALLAQGLALRQVLSLMIAQRRPSMYLGPEGHAKLSELTAGYLRLMANKGYISPALRDAGLAREVTFRDFSKTPAIKPIETDKGVLMVRSHLSGLLGAPLYDLDRLDLAATTTLQHELQEQVSEYLDQLSDPSFARDAGLFGDRLLSASGTEQVRYSFTLFESTPYGNFVRVQTDNTNQPFDINEGSKLEMGSTAKLRVFVTYLEVIAEIHERYADASQQALRQELGKSHDNLTRWVLRYMADAKDKSLPATLRAAMERRYSASPHEVFFTGGGQHTFRNFNSADNGRNPSVREALLESINLPFVRLMRDLVRYSMYQVVSNPVQLLENGRDPRRRVYLTRFADYEGKIYMQRFWRKYKGKNPEERLSLLFSGLRNNPVRLAAAHRYLYPETDSVSFEKLLRAQVQNSKLTHQRIMELYHLYGPDAFNLPDQGYITKVHPLELWLLSYMRRHPDADWAEVVKASQDKRQEVYVWLFRTRFKHARDSRIRTMLELDAFPELQKRWEKLGYPFRTLVPSYATALGSSGDRPAALAELMGIILNNGVRKQTVRVEKLHFAASTPYETIVGLPLSEGKQVLAPEVAAAVRETLAEVVNQGTGRRLRGGFMRTDGNPLPVGGKTGTGDNRLVTVSRGGHRLTSRAINRTATFVFYLGDHHFGTLTAFVPGRQAEDFHFTSSLPIQVLRGMAPLLQPYLEPGADSLCRDTAGSVPVGGPRTALEGRTTAAQAALAASTQGN